MDTRRVFANFSAFFCCVVLSAAVSMAGDGAPATDQERLQRGTDLIQNGSVPQEVDEGVAILKSIAEQDANVARDVLPDMLFMAGTRYLRQEEPDLKKAISLFRESAELDSPHGQAMLGVMLSSEDTGVTDLVEAKKWFEKSSDKGHPISQYFLGTMLLREAAGENDSDKCMAGWYLLKLSAAQGTPDAVTDLEKLTKRSRAMLESITPDEQAIVDAGIRKAEQGDAAEQYRLAWHYYDMGSRSIDYDKAIYWFEKAGENGHRDAQKMLAKFYDTVPGLKDDIEKFLYWSEKAAAQNSLDSLYRLGVLYSLGEKVERDMVKGPDYLFKAHELGHPEAMKTLNLVYGNSNDNGPEDRAEQIEWLRRGAERGVANAQFQLGLAYALGYGGKEDLVSAAKWLEKAAEHDMHAAQWILGDFYYNGQGVKRDIHKARELYQKAHDNGSPNVSQDLLDKVNEEIRAMEEQK